LIADDLDINRDLLSFILKPTGFEICMVADGAEAVAQAEAWLPHVVLMDLRMPVIDGYEATRRIRAALGSNVKIIAVSASVFNENKQLAKDAGVDAFLAKPYNPSELLELIRQLTGIKYVSQKKQQTEQSVESVPELPTSEEIQRLPSDLTAQLFEATCRADYDQMLALAEKASSYEASIGRRLRKLIESYDYGALQKILKT
jgi:CheY-like chemotaxis protein